MKVAPARALVGHVVVPGDKSVSHRAVLLGAIADGPVHVTGFGRSGDTESTVNAVRALGVEVEEPDVDELVVQGRGLRGLRVIADRIRRVVPQANCTQRIPRTAGTKRAPRRFSLKCSNLARGESMKDPVCIFECRRGFSLWSGRSAAARNPRAMRSGGSDHRITQELTRPLWSLLTGKGAPCPCGWKF